MLNIKKVLASFSSALDTDILREGEETGMKLISVLGIDSGWLFTCLLIFVSNVGNVETKVLARSEKVPTIRVLTIEKVVPPIIVHLFITSCHFVDKKPRERL